MFTLWWRRVASRRVRRPDTATLAAEIDALREQIAGLQRAIEASQSGLSPVVVEAIARTAERWRVVGYLRAMGLPEAAAAIGDERHLDGQIGTGERSQVGERGTVPQREQVKERP